MRGDTLFTETVPQERAFCTITLSGVLSGVPRAVRIGGAQLGTALSNFLRLERSLSVGLTVKFLPNNVLSVICGKGV